MGTDLRVTDVDRSYLDPETKAAALQYLQRTGNADVAEALGLVVDPIAAARSRAKARWELSSTSPAPRAPVEVPPGHCPLCGNPIPKSGACRKRLVCREALVRAEVEAADRLIDRVLSEEDAEL